jgi:single-strand DNA-binding protein
MYNKAILMGRIVNDLELKTTPSGVSVLSFRIAVDRRFQTKGEEKKTDFLNIVAWRNEAEFISRYFAKGRMILIEGEIQTRSYQDKNGNTAYVTEIVVDRSTFTGEKKDNGTSGTTGYSSAPAAASYAPTTPASSVVVAPDDDDDYPF